MGLRTLTVAFRHSLRKRNGAAQIVFPAPALPDSIRSSMKLLVIGSGGREHALV
jgi:hypothetical protein